MVNANPRNIQLLTDLGLDHILELDKEGKMWAAERQEACVALRQCRERSAECKEEQAQHVLDSHQALAGVSEANECRFHDVIQFLEKDLHSHDAAAPA